MSRAILIFLIVVCGSVSGELRFGINAVGGGFGGYRLNSRPIAFMPDDAMSANAPTNDEPEVLGYAGGGIVCRVVFTEHFDVEGDIGYSGYVNSELFTNVGETAHYTPADPGSGATPTSVTGKEKIKYERHGIDFDIHAKLHREIVGKLHIEGLIGIGSYISLKEQISYTEPSFKGEYEQGAESATKDNAIDSRQIKNGIGLSANLGAGFQYFVAEEMDVFIRYIAKFHFRDIFENTHAYTSTYEHIVVEGERLVTHEIMLGITLGRGGK